jgi:hypothetical protein
MQTLFNRLFRPRPTRNVTVTLLMLDERDWLAFVTEKPAVNARGPFPASAVGRVEKALRVHARRTGSRHRHYVAGIPLRKNFPAPIHLSTHLPVMKKQFFFKEYLIRGDEETKAIRQVATVEVDFAHIEQELPSGAQIKPETVQTVIEGGRFIVYGEYALPVALEELIARDSINIEEVLGDQETLPSIN